MQRMPLQCNQEFQPFYFPYEFHLNSSILTILITFVGKYFKRKGLRQKNLQKN